MSKSVRSALEVTSALEGPPLKKLCSLIFVLLSSLIPGRSLAQVTLPTSNGDIGAQINAAAAALPASGGKIVIETQANGQCYSFSIPIVLTKAIILEGQGPSTYLRFSGSGVAVSVYGNDPSFVPGGSYADGFGLRDLTLLGSGVTGSQTALSLGGTNNSVGFYGLGLTISNFGLGLQFGRGAW